MQFTPADTLQYLQFKLFKEKVVEELGDQTADFESQLKKFKDKKIQLSELFPVFVKTFDEQRVESI